MTETKIVSDETKERSPMSRKEARVLVNCVDFCRILRERKIFPDVDEISHTAIKNAARFAATSEEWQQEYLSQDGWLVKLGYMEQLNETHYGEAYYRLTGKDINQEEQARIERSRLGSSSK